jgi:multiple sugar transport system permease protein
MAGSDSPVLRRAHCARRGHRADSLEGVSVSELLATLQSIPANLYEAAQVDGASPWQRFRYITWPGIRASATLAAILNTLWALREFDIVYLTTGGGPDRATETLAVRIYQEAFAFFRMGTASALGVLTMVMAALLVLMSMRTLRREFF